MNGADPLEGLHDIVLPEPVSWLPQTAGWAVLLSLAIGVAAWVAWRVVRRNRRRRYRRLALAELEALTRGLERGDRDSFSTALPELVKRTALAAYPRSEVAALTGDEWLGFLDGTIGSDAFSVGSGRWLPEVAYGARPETEGPTGKELEELTSVVRRWIVEHRAPGNDRSAAPGGG